MVKLRHVTHQRCRWRSGDCTRWYGCI